MRPESHEVAARKVKPEVRPDGRRSGQNSSLNKSPTQTEVVPVGSLSDETGLDKCWAGWAGGRSGRTRYSRSTRSRGWWTRWRGHAEALLQITRAKRIWRVLAMMRSRQRRALMWGLSTLMRDCTTRVNEEYGGSDGDNSSSGRNGRAQNGETKST